MERFNKSGLKLNAKMCQLFCVFMRYITEEVLEYLPVRLKQFYTLGVQQISRNFKKVYVSRRIY